jgi:hypothetical protein
MEGVERQHPARIGGVPVDLLRAGIGHREEAGPVRAQNRFGIHAITLYSGVRVHLRRRGCDHGRFTVRSRATSWSAGEPVVLRRFVRPPSCRAELAVLERLRAGEDLASVTKPPKGMRFTGVSQNTQDPLELHKLHVEPGDLYVKVNWLSTHPGDGSIRLRFSYGVEVLDDWKHDARGVRRTMELAAALFPATRIAMRRAAALKLIQPIVYSNQPDGGALFHHDYVPGQTGVCFTQFAGSTAWLALPRPVLERHARDHAGRRIDIEKAEKLLNRTPAFTRRLADDGWLFVLKPGDAILLPSPTLATAAWHAVFAASKGPNLALSCGFRRPSRSFRSEGRLW